MTYRAGSPRNGGGEGAGGFGGQGGAKAPPSLVPSAAQRGLDSICTSDRLLAVTRPEVAGAHKALRNAHLRGLTVSRTLAVDPSVPYCDDPQRIVQRARGGRSLHSAEVISDRPCRKCAKCLQFRQMRWRQRALVEISQARRTWWCTFTFSPVHLAGVLMRAKGGSIKHIDQSAYAEIKNYFKRLRSANPRCKVRYLAVYERGEETGRSHYHILLHDCGARPILKRQIQEKWPSFTNVKLVNEDANGVASYVTKYLTKSVETRPRASCLYGRF